MQLKTWLSTSVKRLQDSGVATAVLDAEVLLADALTVDRSWLHAHPELELSQEQITDLNTRLERRKNHEPLAYIRGKQEFYGREFFVSPDTLTPRPETETMVEMVLAYLMNDERRTKNEEELQILDVGTGSGCIIITLALELHKIFNPGPRPSKIQAPRSQIHYLGLDISKKALKIAEQNTQHLHAPVTFQHFNLKKDHLRSEIEILDLGAWSLEGPQPSKIQDPSSQIYLANLPYVPDDFHINLAASHEPSFAIFGGDDGLDYYRLLFKQISELGSQSLDGLKLPRSKIQDQRSITVFTESLPPQHAELEKIAHAHGFRLQKEADFIQQFAR